MRSRYCQRALHLMENAESEQDWLSAEQHIASCQDCQELLRVDQAGWAPEIDQLLAEANQQVRVRPVTLDPRLLTTPAREKTLKATPRLGWGVLSLAAVVCLIVGIVVWPKRDRSQQLSQVSPESVSLESTEPNEKLHEDPQHPTRASGQSTVDGTETPQPPAETPVALRAQPGFIIAQQDTSEEIPFFWVLPSSQ